MVASQNEREFLSPTLSAIRIEWLSFHSTSRGCELNECDHAAGQRRIPAGSRMVHLCVAGVQRGLTQANFGFLVSIWCPVCKGRERFAGVSRYYRESGEQTEQQWFRPKFWSIYNLRKDGRNNSAYRSGCLNHCSLRVTDSDTPGDPGL